MWKKFKLRLGKIVQGALNIFKKKKPQYERGLRAKCNFLEDSLIGQEVTLSNEELFIDGVSFGKVLGVEKIPLFEKTDAPAQLKRDLAWDKEPIVFEGEFTDQGLEELKKLASTPYQVLPKRYSVPTLIVSTYASWDYDSIGVDLSQLEEKGVAHFFCTSTKSMEEHIQEFREKYPDWEEEEGEEDEGVSIAIPNATLLEWPGGYWEWYA